MPCENRQVFVRTHLIFASAIGRIAFNHFSQTRSGKVIGNTSRGMFILSDPGRVVFVTHEPFHGPQSINLPRTHSDINTISPETRVDITPQQVRFDDMEQVIDLSIASIWEPDLRPVDLYLNHSEILERTRQTAMHFLSKRVLGPVTAYLIPILDIQPSQDTPKLLMDIDLYGLLDTLKTNQEQETVQHLSRCIGYGQGLTPSGDDFITGILLFLSRWGDLFLPELSPMRIGNPLVQNAQGQTTSLSLNIMENSIIGQADERLIQALDGLISGNLTPVQCSQLLLAWGNSSGGDALTGFASVIASYFRPTISKIS